MNMNRSFIPKTLTGGAMVIAVTSVVFAQEKPYTQPGLAQPPARAAGHKSALPTAAKAPAAAEPSSFEKFFSAQIPEALAQGKFSLNSRLRFEYVDQHGGFNGATPVTDPSYAPTIRTRFGYTSAPLYGFQGMLEGENIAVIGSEDNYNAAGTNGKGYKPAVADIATTELNQAWLSYSHTNWISVKGGRQRIALDNHRFIGDVGWRQNMQTYDAISAESRPLNNLSLYYGYLWEVHRVFGNDPRLAAANRDFRSDSHVINIAYTPFDYGRFVGYTYLLDLENRAGSTQSSATYGGYFAGAAPVAEKVSLGYRAELAWQTDYADSPQAYQAEYYNVELGATIHPVSFGGGYEVLGSDSDNNAPGSVGFRTPLATLHAHNGWADAFLATPAKGLRDLYGFVQVVLPLQIPVRAVYHNYHAASGGADFGQEIDVQVSKKLGRHWTVLGKYAYYDGKEAPNAFDVHKLWAQVEFNF
jgi:hypothetical protein